MATVVDCPVCATEVRWEPTSAWRPFCSKRCKLIDLGDWAAERHAIPGSTSGSDSLDPASLDGKGE